MKAEKYPVSRAEENNTVLEVRNLSFRYGKTLPQVLRGVSFSLHAGEIGVLLGKNGAGKTTLLKMLINAEKPSLGEILLGGTPLTALSFRERAKRISYVPQNVSFGELSVFDTVLCGRIPEFGFRAGKEDKDAVLRVLSEFGLSELADRSASKLSGGEMQKVAAARALAAEPELILFDEPSGNLDPANTALLRNIILDFSRNHHIAVLCSLHSLNEAAALGDRFFFLRDGVLRYDGGSELLCEEVLFDIYGIRPKIYHIDGETVITGGYIS